MLYKTSEEILTTEKLSVVEKVKKDLLHFLDLNEQEKDALAKIVKEKDLLLLKEEPGRFFTSENSIKFAEIIEMFDIMEGIYYA